VHKFKAPIRPGDQILYGTTQFFGSPIWNLPVGRGFDYRLCHWNFSLT